VIEAHGDHGPIVKEVKDGSQARCKLLLNTPHTRGIIGRGASAFDYSSNWPCCGHVTCLPLESTSGEADESDRLAQDGFIGQQVGRHGTKSECVNA